MGGKTYCCVAGCHNFQGKVENGEKITLHRFPSGDSKEKRRLSKIWEFRVSRKSFKVEKWTRICSAHFVGGNGPTDEHTIPSIFPHKTFKTSQLDSYDETEGAASVLDTRGEVLDTSQEETSASFMQESSHSELDVSVTLHDYVCRVEKSSLSSHRHKEMQCQVSSINSECQTEISLCAKSNKLCQTEQTLYKSVGCQTDIVPDLTINDISDKEVMFFTGIPDKVTFRLLFDECSDDLSQSGENQRGRPRKLTYIDEFFLVLMRIRLGLLELDLAKRFKVSQSTVSTVCSVWIDRMYSKLSFLVWWTPKNIIQNNMPLSFKNRYPSTRVIIDCTEIFTETPTSLINKTLLYSDYKSHNTWKALIGINPNGVITFVSDLWGGNTSDKQIVVRSNFLDLCESGDAIMADKGFQIMDLTIPRGLHLIIPPRKKKNQQFSSEEVEATRRIANLRIHVERANARVKTFRILQGVVPLSMADQIDKVFKLCCFLTNLQPPLIND